MAQFVKHTMNIGTAHVTLYNWQNCNWLLKWRSPEPKKKKTDDNVKMKTNEPRPGRTKLNDAMRKRQQRQMKKQAKTEATAAALLEPQDETLLNVWHQPRQKERQAPVQPRTPSPSPSYTDLTVKPKRRPKGRPMMTFGLTWSPITTRQTKNCDPDDDSLGNPYKEVCKLMTQHEEDNYTDDEDLPRNGRSALFSCPLVEVEPTLRTGRHQWTPRQQPDYQSVQTME